MFKRERVIFTFRIQDGHSRWHRFVWNVMVTNNKVNAKAFGIRNFIDCLYAAIENNNKFHTCFTSIVYSLLAHSISFVVSVWDIVVYVGIELL